MLFLPRYAFLFICLFLVQYHSCLLFSIHKADRVESSVEMVPLSKKVIMRPFAKLQQQVRAGVNHYRLDDDDYDAQFGYNYLLIGNDLYNEPLPEAYRKYLTEQYYTRRSTLWCVRSNSQK